MRKRLFVLALAIMAIMSVKAQETVYFSNLTDKVGIGFGISKKKPHTVIVSIMQVSKQKNFNNFSLDMVDMDGQHMGFEMKMDTIFHLDTGKTLNHQADYEMNIFEFNKMCSQLTSQSTVYVNNVEYNGAALAGVLRQLQQEQANSFLKPMEFKNVMFWNVPNQDRQIMLMRFNKDKRHMMFIRQFGANK